jgi:hypothetical protein
MCALPTCVLRIASQAGGFLARDWGSGSTAQLHTASFTLHEQLAEELGIESFRKLPTLNVKVGRKGAANAASWLDGKATSSLMDTGTAQVTPLELTEKFMAAAQGTYNFSFIVQFAYMGEARGLPVSACIYSQRICRMFWTCARTALATQARFLDEPYFLQLLAP